MRKSAEKTFARKDSAKRAMMTFRDKNPDLVAVQLAVVPVAGEKDKVAVQATGWSNADVAAIDAAGFVRIENDDGGAAIAAEAAADEAARGNPDLEIDDAEAEQLARESDIDDAAAALVAGLEAREAIADEDFNLSDGELAPFGEAAAGLPDVAGPLTDEDFAGSRTPTLDELPSLTFDSYVAARETALALGATAFDVVAVDGGGFVVSTVLGAKAAKAAKRKADKEAAKAKADAKSKTKGEAVERGKAARKAKAAEKKATKAKGGVTTGVAKTPKPIRPDGSKTKKEQMLDMICAPAGATEDEICAAIGWKKCRTTLMRSVKASNVALRVEKNAGEKKQRYFGTRAAA